MFLYCVVGYIINGCRTKDWSTPRNIPNYRMWITLPKAVYVGCGVTCRVLSAPPKQDKPGLKGLMK